MKRYPPKDGLLNEYDVIQDLIDKLETQYEKRLEQQEDEIDELRQNLNSLAQDTQTGLDDVHAAIHFLADKVEELEAEGRSEAELVLRDSSDRVPREEDEDAEADVETEDSAEADSSDIDVEEPGEGDTDSEDDSDDVECPQCGEEYEKPISVGRHMVANDDHVSPVRFFRNREGLLKCIVCDKEYDDRQVFLNHLQYSHGTSSTRLLLENFEELKDAYVDGIYDFEGNIPDLHQVKKIGEYSGSEVEELVFEFLDSEGSKLSLQKIADDLFDQEAETNSADYMKLYMAMKKSDRIYSGPNPYDSRRKVFFTGSAEEEVEQ